MILQLNDCVWFQLSQFSLPPPPVIPSPGPVSMTWDSFSILWFCFLWLVRVSLFRYFHIILLSVHFIEPQLPQYYCIQVFYRGHYLSSRTTHPRCPMCTMVVLCVLKQQTTTDSRDEIDCVQVASKDLVKS